MFSLFKKKNTIIKYEKGTKGYWEEFIDPILEEMQESKDDYEVKLTVYLEKIAKELSFLVGREVTVKEVRLVEDSACGHCDYFYKFTLYLQWFVEREKAKNEKI